MCELATHTFDLSCHRLDGQKEKATSDRTASVAVPCVLLFVNPYFFSLSSVASQIGRRRVWWTKKLEEGRISHGGEEGKATKREKAHAGPCSARGGNKSLDGGEYRLAMSLSTHFASSLASDRSFVLLVVFLQMPLPYIVVVFIPSQVLHVPHASREYVCAALQFLSCRFYFLPLVIRRHVLERRTKHFSSLLPLSFC